MERQELLRTQPALDSFLAEFAPCAIAPTRKLIAAFVRGQLGPLPRKSVMPMALEAGIPPRTLQELLSLHRWDEALMTDLLRKRVLRRRGGGALTAGVVFQGIYPKRGTRTPGVERQYVARTQKAENCVVMMHLLASAGSFVCLLDSDLYLPESWTRNSARRDAAGIPPDVPYRTKSEIAMRLIERARAGGLEFDWLLFDEEQAESASMFGALEERGQRFVVDIPPGLRGWTRSSGEGPVCAAPLAASRAGFEPVSVGGKSWNLAAATFWPESAGRPGAARRLLAAEPAGGGPGGRLLLSSLQGGGTPAELLEAASSRRRIERRFAEQALEVGLGHFEVRTYRSLRRHFTLSSLSHLFLAERAGALEARSLDVGSHA